MVAVKIWIIGLVISQKKAENLVVSGDIVTTFWFWKDTLVKI